ncbi:MAG: hypothetical protein IPL88_02130 [Rhizobiales bacterium]|nr:hypothetical protein [Hyphomicrobiales bacterium]
MIGRRLLWLLVGLAALAAMMTTRVSHARLTGPIEIAVAAGAEGRARSFRARLLGLATARQIVWREGGAEARRSTNAVWLMAALEAEALDETTGLVPLWRGRTGRLTSASRRLSGAPQMIAAAVLQPGFPRRGFAVFEVPEDEIAGGALILGPSLAPTYDARLSFAPPDKPIVAQDAAQLTQTPQ